MAGMSESWCKCNCVEISTPGMWTFSRGGFGEIEVCTSKATPFMEEGVLCRRWKPP